ncbi:MAG: hypothetical protein ACOX0M_00805 [Salinivirgaceae bacterium]|nr:hypothetical protein [Bacteroidales bacterium]
MNLKTNAYNELFDQINELTWYPWIGSNYNENRLLIVGESHYAQDEDGNIDLECYNAFLKDKNLTIGIVELLMKGSSWKFFQNTYHALLRTENINREAFWSNVAFYNFIQRPMKTTKDRPLKADYSRGWDVFYEVSKVIKPSHCIFLGSGSAQYLYPVMKEKKDIIFADTKCTIEQWHKQIGIYWGKIAHLEYEEVNTDITFIKHPSKFFKKDDWNDYLMERIGGILENLKSKTKAK